MFSEWSRSFCQQVLGRVRQAIQHWQIKKAGIAFDGVHDAKHAADEFVIIRVLFQRHQLALQAFQMLLRFDQKILHHVIKLGLHKPPLPHSLINVPC
jgi:hypothetical protein